jgi:beta-glucanase (GH16 family)
MMKAQVFRCAAVSVIGLALATGMACGKADSTHASAAGGAAAGTGVSSAASSGPAAGTGGSDTGTAGATGGVVVATGGGGTGGSVIGSGGVAGGGGAGGRATGSGGTGGSGANDGGASDGSSVRNDGSAKGDLSSDGSQRPEVGSDVPLGDAPAAADSGIAIPPGYKLVWSDEFNADGTPSSKNWNYEKGFVRNEELQWYQPDNATVKDGLLVIEGRKQRVANPNYQAGSSDWKTSRQYAEYTATSMTTSGLQSWQYGRFEMRARIPTSSGMWPAWWTLGSSGEWPSNGEVDIMEYYKGNVLANVACGTSTRWSAKWDSSTKALSSLGSGWASNFHTWRMDWDDQKIDLYLDDTLMNSVTLSTMLNADGTSPFKQKAYMLVNLAIGGANGGDPASTTFPQKYEIDWIRVFQKQ